MPKRVRASETLEAPEPGLQEDFHTICCTASFHFKPLTQSQCEAVVIDHEDIVYHPGEEPDDPEARARGVCTTDSQRARALGGAKLQHVTLSPLTSPDYTAQSGSGAEYVLDEEELRRPVYFGDKITFLEENDDYSLAMRFGTANKVVPGQMTLNELMEIVETFENHKRLLDQNASRLDISRSYFEGLTHVSSDQYKIDWSVPL